MSQALERIRQVARERKKEWFTALFHHINPELLTEAFFELEENAAPGVDRLTWKDYEADLERNLEDLHDRVQRGAYRALPSRRVYIPKPDVAAFLDDQRLRAVGALLSCCQAASLAVSYPPTPINRTHAPRCGERMPSCPMLRLGPQDEEDTNPCRETNRDGKTDIDPFTPRRLSRARVKPLVVEKVKEQTPAPLRCPRCGAKMKLTKITSKPAERPKLTASCPDCD